MHSNKLVPKYRFLSIARFFTAAAWAPHDGATSTPGDHGVPCGFRFGERSGNVIQKEKINFHDVGALRWTELLCCVPGIDKDGPLALDTCRGGGLHGAPELILTFKDRA
jgi:hypothetical protein